MTQEVFEADEKMNAYVASVVQQLCRFGSRPDQTIAENYVMSLGIAVITQTYVALGGNIQEGEVFGETVKQCIISTMKAYCDARRVTHSTPRVIN